MDSQPRSRSTETPSELETPQAITSWVDDIAANLAIAPPAEKPRPRPAQAREVSIIPPGALHGVKVLEEGREVVRPDVVQTVVSLAQLGQLVRIRKSLQKEEFQGKLDPRDLSATGTPQFVDLIEDWPNTPWITASFANDGPDTVHIGINHQAVLERVPAGETLEINFAKADERIKLIEYKCAAGETASVRVVGKY